MKTFVDKYLLLNLKDYFGDSVNFPINLVLLGICLGVIFAIFAANRQRQTLYTFVKQLFRHDAFSEGDAKDLAELGLGDNRSLCRALQSGGKIFSLVTVVGRQTPTYEEHLAAERAKKAARRKGKGTAKAEGQPTPAPAGVTAWRFYIAPPQSDAAKRIYEADSPTWVQSVLCSVIVFAAFALLFFLMPVILPAFAV